MLRIQSERCDASRAGFSLVELIGVLAILVIRGVLIIPRILNRGGTVHAAGAANQAQVDQVLASVQAIKAAAAQHCARFGSLVSRNGTPFTVSGSYHKYDSVLLSEQLLDRPFRVRLGAGATVRLVHVAGGGAFDLDGRGARGIAGVGYVLEVVIPGLSEDEARALNDGLDGPGLGANPGEEDTRGKVTYHGGGPGEPPEVHIDIMHE